MEPLQYIRKISYIDQSKSQATGALIFLHGSCGTGFNFHDWVESLLGDKSVFPHIKIIFPTAPDTKYTPLGGCRVPTWYDISGFTKGSVENETDIENVCNDMVKLVNYQVACGIPRDRIVIAGFSRGGGLAFHLGLRYIKDIAGIGVLSSFLPDTSLVFKDLETNNEKLPKLFQQHGIDDSLVDIKEAEDTFTRLKSFGAEAEFKSYPEVGHDISVPELEDFYNFVKSVVPDV